MFPKIIFFGKWEIGGKMDVWKIKALVWRDWKRKPIAPIVTASFFVMAPADFEKVT